MWEWIAATVQASCEHMELMLDLGPPTGLSEALRIAKMIEDFGVEIAWWEEPLSSSDDLESLAELNQGTDLTIAASESEITSFAIREMLRRKAVGVVQPDLSWVGGITEGKRIAELCRFWNVPMVLHNWVSSLPDTSVAMRHSIETCRGSRLMSIDHKFPVSAFLPPKEIGGILAAGDP